MKEQPHLTSTIIQSIKSYFSNRTSYDEIANLKGNHRSLYFSWYIEWMKHVSSTKQAVWNTIRQQKNNLVFINLIFVQFDELLQMIVQSTETVIESPTVRLESYYEYANDVHIEAFGKSLTEKKYTKKELLKIIKECEKVIHTHFINHTKPEHNVVMLQN